MKIKFLFMLSGLVMLIFTLTSFENMSVLNAIACNIQETKVVNAVYDGHEEYGYNFIAKGENDEEHTITFQKVGDVILKVFNLNSEVLVGTKFKITYTNEVVVTKDEDGYDDENEINTITNLVKL